MRSSRRTVIIAVLMIIVSLLSACYSDEAFTDIKNHPEKRVVSNKEGVIDEYYSDMNDTEEKDKSVEEATDKKVYKKSKKGKGRAGGYL